MKSKIFSFDIPEKFTLAKDKRGFVRLENRDETYDLQWPFIELMLFPLDSLQQTDGDSLMDKYISWTKQNQYKPELISSEETQFKGYKTCVLELKTDALYHDKHFKISYFTACIILDDNWFLGFMFCCETKVAEKYKPIRNKVFHSIEINGTADDYLQAHEQDRADAIKEYKESIQALAEEENSRQKKLPKIKPFKIPQDGKELCKIGQFKFEFMAEQCYWHIAESGLYLQIQAKTPQTDKATKAELIEEDYGFKQGEIQFSFPCTGIYNKGIPGGTFTFEEDKTGAPQHIYFHKKGIHYSLDFYGKVDMQAGWLAFNGYLKAPYNDEPVFPLCIYKKMKSDQLDWSRYRFNFQEAIQMEPETVQYLYYITAPDPKQLPEKIFQFTNLKELTISGDAPYSEHSEFNEISEQISRLSQLTEFQIFDTSLTEIPEAIGELKQLEQLNLSNNKLEQLPESLFQLPKLKYLWLSKNLIAQIPENIHLPELRNANFADNQLKTLPETLAQQPKLSELNLENNPLEFLPDAFNKIAAIELDIDDKRRLLNYSYPGADGKGMTTWNNKAYLAKHDDKLHELFINAIKGTVLEKYQSALETLALKAVCINTTEKDDYSTVGNTRFGGLPDLPQGEAYPKWEAEWRNEKHIHHYQFIAQLNCAELAEYQNYLPAAGILYFYLQDQEDFGCKVIYVPDAQNLQSAKQIDADSLDIFDDDNIYEPFKTSYCNFVALPSFYSDDFWYKLANAPELEQLEDDKDQEAYLGDVSNEISKKLGKKGRYREWNNTYYPDEHHSINDYIFTQHESPQEQAALKLKGNPEDWVVLLKVASDNDCGFCFCDAGELFFVIHKSDLTKADFSNVYASIETS